MPGGRHLVAWLVTATVAALAVCAPLSPASGQADRLPIAIADMRGARGDTHERAALRSALAAELESLGGFRVAPRSRARWVLRGAVTRLDHERLGAGLEVQCEVSLVLSDGGGTVRALLSGRAAARGGSPATIERAALQAAVRGALRPLPETLGQRPTSARSRPAGEGLPQTL